VTTIQISGAKAAESASILRARLVAQIGNDAVSEVQSHSTKGPDVVALLSLVFGGISAADILWKWWQARRDSGIEVRIETRDGDAVEIRGSSYEALKKFLAKVDER
jgi:hypothetical protein